MTRTESAEIAAVRQRIKAAAKATVPLTRRAAAQLRDDLATWQRWAADGVTFVSRIGLSLFALDCRGACSARNCAMAALCGCGTRMG